MRRLLAVTVLVGLTISAFAPLGADAAHGSAGAGPWDLGAVTLLPEVPAACPPGASACVAFSVECPGVDGERLGALALWLPLGLPRGVLFLHNGSNGTTYLQPGGDAFSTFLREEGFTLVAAKWEHNWQSSLPGDRAGIAHTGCRPASVAKWAHDTFWAPIEPLVGGGLGRCGFCVVGFSNGATAVAMPLAYYGGDAWIDAGIFIGGPVHTDLVVGCYRLGDDPEAWYGHDSGNPGQIDAAFGFPVGGGPCTLRDPAWEPRLHEESMARAANDWDHPATRMHFQWGGKDDTIGVPHGRLYAAALRDAGTPHLVVEFFPEAPHGVFKTPEGLRALRDAILAEA